MCAALLSENLGCESRARHNPQQQAPPSDLPVGDRAAMPCALGCELKTVTQDDRPEFSVEAGG